MRIIKYIELYKELMDLYGEKFKVVKVINQIRHFDPELKDAFYTFFDKKGKTLPNNLSRQGVTLRELVDGEGMNPLRAFLMLDWISKNPRDAMEYMASYRFRSPISFSSAELEKIEKLLSKQGVSDIEETIKEDTTNIDVDEQKDDSKNENGEKFSQTTEINTEKEKTQP